MPLHIQCPYIDTDSAAEVYQNKLFFLVAKLPPKVPNGGSSCIFFTTDDDFKYYSFCDDFGPFNLAVAYRFCAKLRLLYAASGSDQIVYYTTGDARQAANCAFLLAAFLVMELGQPAEVAQSWLRGQESLLAEFGDASYGKASFALSVTDSVCCRYLLILAAPPSAPASPDKASSLYAS
jgi:hypothetical protein